MYYQGCYRKRIRSLLLTLLRWNFWKKTWDGSCLKVSKFKNLESGWDHKIKKIKSDQKIILKFLLKEQKKSQKKTITMIIDYYCHQTFSSELSPLTFLSVLFLFEFCCKGTNKNCRNIFSMVWEWKFVWYMDM